MSGSFVFEMIGTVVSLRTSSPLPGEAFAALVSAFAAADDRFNHGRADAEATRFAGHGLAVDPSGIVTALALADAATALTTHGVTDWCLNAGGDVVTDGVQPDGLPWVVGIADPDDRAALLSQAVAGVGRRAVATSGTPERREHPHADPTFTQVTVCAVDIVTADALATAILAGGPAALHRAHGLRDIDVLACAGDGRLWASPAFLADTRART